MKRIVNVCLVLVLILGLVACGQTTVEESSEKQEEVINNKTDDKQKTEESNEAQEAEETKVNQEDGKNSEITDKTVVKTLNGPTTIGMSMLINDQQQNTDSMYDFEVVTMAQDVVNGLVKGDVDIAAIPANLAATVYNKTKGKIQVAAVNTLSVVYIVDNDGTVKSVQDLVGKTIYATGQGQTPEYILTTILKDNGIDPAKDVTLEFKNEPSEVASILAKEENVVALLPQPFITVAQSKNDKINVAIDLNEEWKNNHESNIITGVLVVNKDYAENNKETFNQFLEDYKNSIISVNSNPEEAAPIIEKLGVIKAPIAIKAIPNLKIRYMDELEMQDNLTGYLTVLEELNPQSIGGKLPGEDFYYKK